VRNYGDFRQCVIPIPITCILQGTPCDTGIPYTFYGENICSVCCGKAVGEKSFGKKPT
jgi:hypothetical protein